MDESCMTVTKQKKSMSVKEMGELLGLKKVESYWLIKKNFFETREVAGVLRVMIDSFEEWYAGQFHYKKTNGPPPGSKFGEIISIQQIAEDLGISRTTASQLMHREKTIKIIIVENTKRVDKKSHDNWYKNQHHYVKKAEKERNSNNGFDIQEKE